MRKRVLSMLLVFCMILTWLPTSALAVDAAQPYATPANTDASTIWDGSVADSYAGGSGTSGDPYLIATAEQLARVADQVNSGAESGKSYRLLNDIYLNGVSSVNIWDTVVPQNKWVPIGSASTLFSGVFDGAGYSVQGLYISTADTYQGLFGSVTSSGPISNLSIEESYINGGNYVGGICGYSSSSLSNCHNGATVIGGSYVSGIVGGVGNPGGCLVGQ